MKKRVLIVSASAGTGHVRAAQALEKAFAADPRVGEIQHLDALIYTNKLFREFYSRLYITLVRSAPQVLGWAYKASDLPWKNEAVRLQLDRLNTRPLVKFIRDFRADITVCTHFMPTGIIGHLIALGHVKANLSVAITDLDCHAMWLCRTFCRYFVALPETKAFLETLGLPGERITVSGIPIDPVFADEIDRAATRRSYGLDAEKTTLLLSAGALGVGPTEAIVRSLQRLRHDAQTVVVCGKSAELRARMESLVSADNPRFRLLGYTDRMHELVRCADLFIGKPGGLTTAEALACGLPMAIVSPIPGQEERNSDHLLEQGIAIKCNEIATIPYKLDALLAEPGRLESMRQRAFAAGRPHAAHTVAQTLLDDTMPLLTLEKKRPA